MDGPGSGADDLGLCPAGLRSRFQVTSRLGAGGMGAVFRGTHAATGKPVALKVILGQASRNAVARLVREARLLGQVRHPNLVEVYDGGLEDGAPWVAMELIEGEDLSARARRLGGTLPPEEVLEVLGEVASVLTALRRAGIVHRDIKPQNLMRDASGRTVVMDLGLALSSDDTRYTATGSLVGTLPYMAPEMFLEQRDGAALDWYALGVVGLRLATGLYPYQKTQLMSMAALGEWNLPPALPSRFRGTPLGKICLRLLEADPKRRLTSSRGLQALVEGRPEEFSTSFEAFHQPRPSRRSWSRWLVPLCILGLVLGLGLGRMQEAPPPLGPEGPALSSPDQTPETSLASARLPAWETLARELGMVRGGDALLFLDTLLRTPDDRRLEDLETLTGGQPPGPLRDFFRFRWYERRGLHEEMLAMARRETFSRPPEGYIEARLLVEYLGVRLLEARIRQNLEWEEIRRDPGFLSALERLDAFLASSPEADLQGARLELWGLIARRIQPRPRFNLPALEACEELGRRLFPRRDALSPLARVAYMREFTRCLLRLGEREQRELFLELESARALAPLGDPELRETWLGEMRWERGAVSGVADVLAADNLFSPTRERVDRTFLGPEVRSFVADPPTPRPLEIGGREGAEAPLALLQEKLDLARLQGARLRISETWARAHLLEGIRSRDPEVTRQLTRSPDLIRSLTEILEQEGLHETFLELYREADRRARRSQGYLVGRRSWYRGESARLAWELFEYPARLGRPEEGIPRVREYFQGLAALSPPWRIGELAGAKALVRRMRFRLDRHNRCRNYRSESLRLGLKLLETMLEDPRLDPDHRFLKHLHEWLWDWGTSTRLGGPKTRELVGFLEEQLGDEPEDLQATQQFFIEIQAERVAANLSRQKPCLEDPLEGLELFPGGGGSEEEMEERFRRVVLAYPAWRRRRERLGN